MCSKITFSEKYGFLIVLITILVRIFVVSIAWNYGIFIVELKKTFPKYFELEWIAGLAQGIGSLIAPLYLILIKKIGIRLSFMIGLLLCTGSLFSSSFVVNEDILFLSYSIPFGIGSGILMFIGTILTGLYFPAKHRFHMLSTIIISLGFPLGYLILNPLTEYLFQTHEWHYVKRLYSCIALICLIVFSTFFTDKYVTTSTEESEETLLINQEETEIQQLYPSVQYQFLTNIVWLLGLFSFALAINALVLNLNGYFVSVGVSPVDSTHLMMVLGATDVFYRLLLSLLGYFFSNLLVNFYIVSAVLGLILSLFWSSVTAYNLNFAMISGFGLCSAVFMSLQYAVSTELNGVSRIKVTYTLNVMASGLGVMVGPSLSGALLDKYNRDYKIIFELSLACFIFSMIMFSFVKLSILYAKSIQRQQGTRLV